MQGALPGTNEQLQEGCGQTASHWQRCAWAVMCRADVLHVYELQHIGKILEQPKWYSSLHMMCLSKDAAAPKAKRLGCRILVLASLTAAKPACSAGRSTQSMQELKAMLIKQVVALVKNDKVQP